MTKNDQSSSTRKGSPLEVLWAFLRLGCMSFGGPVAHLGYFRAEFVERRRWLNEDSYAELIAMAQALPGPGSSQVGFSIGLLRAGWLGGLAAWVGFTLPSALLMTGFALGYGAGPSLATAKIFHGLQLVAVAVVAHALVTMQRSLAPDVGRIAIACAGAALVLLVPWPLVNLVVIVAAGAAGALFLRRRVPASTTELTLVLPKKQSLIAGAIFFVLFSIALGAAWTSQPLLALFGAFYRTGALVFGGGHVVLPLLERAVVARGWVSQPSFLAGYGVAQALPGPLFSFGAYLGAVTGGAATSTAHRLLFAAVALAAIFLPGLLAMAAVLPLWSTLRKSAHFRSALLGVNAGVVGILAAALVHPLCTSTLHAPADFVVAAAAFALLWVRRVQPWMVVVGVAALSWFVL